MHISGIPTEGTVIGFRDEDSYLRNYWWIAIPT